MTSTFSRIGPGQTPRTVVKLIVITLLVSLVSALWESLFTLLLNFPRLQPYLSLSRYGIAQFFLWQPLTYLFVVDSYGAGITLSYLITLFFTMYITWVLGSAIYEQGGRRQFLQLYFGSGLLSALITLLFLFIAKSSAVFAGPAPALLALFTAWTMLQPETEILLFFIFPVKVKWLFAGVLGAIVLINLSQLAFISLIFYLTPVIFGYLFALFAWNLAAPFSFLYPLDQRLIRLTQKKSKEPKIISLFSGKPQLDDDAFIDAMLAKISEKGQSALTWEEKKRMDAIAEKRQK